MVAISVLASNALAESQTLSRIILLDKIRGGWAGQMIGVAYGAATEFKAKGVIGAWELGWKPGMLENTLRWNDGLTGPGVTLPPGAEWER